LRANDPAALRVGLEAENFIELAYTHDRFAVVRGGRRHGRQRTCRIDGCGKTLGIGHHSLNVCVADRLNVHGGLGRAAQSPIAENATFVFDNAMEGLKGGPDWIVRSLAI
jgi:hypothetical protein